MKRVLIVVVATVTGAFAAGWVSAQGTRGTALTGQDYAEIEQLMAKYYQALDFEDRDMFESIWTEDAVYRINSLGQPVEGRDAIVGRTVGRWADRPPEHERRHWQNNLVLTPNGGRRQRPRVLGVVRGVVLAAQAGAVRPLRRRAGPHAGRLALQGAGALD